MKTQHGCKEVKHNAIVREYCRVIGIEYPLSKNKDQLIKYEVYENENSPIHKSVDLGIPPKKRKKEKKLTYMRYLNSASWKNFKDELKKQRGNKCEHCGRENVTLDGHHLTYERLFNELPSDVLLLCRPCHKLQHNGK